MRFSAIGKLRAAFVALGVALGLPLIWLVQAADARIEAQRRLRHEVVAERIFDELERELTRVLREESSKPSTSFDAPRASSSWAPYVVGYFTSDAEGSPRLLASNELDPARHRRVTWALGRAEVARERVLRDSIAGIAEPGVKSGPAPKLRLPLDPSAVRAGSSSPADVLRQLNRAKDERIEELESDNLR